MSHLFDDVLFEVRRHWKLRVLLPLAVIGVFFIIGALVVGLSWYGSAKERPASNPQDVPLNSYTAGYIESFDCIYRGAQKCPGYESAKTWAAGNVSSTLTYTPAPGDAGAPGSPADGGNRAVENIGGLNDAQWHSLAAGLTRGGAATPGTVTENTVRTEDFNAEQLAGSATFTLTHPSLVKATASYQISDTGVLLSSMTYTEGG